MEALFLPLCHIACIYLIKFLSHRKERGKYVRDIIGACATNHPRPGVRST